MLYCKNSMFHTQYCESAFFLSISVLRVKWCALLLQRGCPIAKKHIKSGQTYRMLEQKIEYLPYFT